MCCWHSLEQSNSSNGMYSLVVVLHMASTADVLLSSFCLQVEEFELPKASTVCSLVILSYFLVTAGIAYDIINEPPAIGAVQDEATGVATTKLPALSTDLL